MDSRLYSKHYTLLYSYKAPLTCILLSWQMNDPGTVSTHLPEKIPFFFLIINNIPYKCYVVRKDRKPLPKEVVETMYEFHSSILGTDYFMDKMSGNTPYEITPKVFQKFSDKYRREYALKDGADGRG